MEMSPLNSTVQNDTTDFDEALVGDTSILFTMPSHDEEESISFDISYEDVPLQSNEHELNDENETSKLTQAKHNKHALCAKIENIILIFQWHMK